MDADTSVHKKMSCYDLMLEVTRRCNMRCEHCLRGDPEDLDMDDRILDLVFSGIEETTIITFTGGEPSLVPDRIQTALEMAMKYGVRVRQVYVVTNGKGMTPEFIDACLAWHRYCLSCLVPPEEIRDGCVDHHMARRVIAASQDRDERTGCYVELSMDPYHGEVRVEDLMAIASLPHTNIDKYHAEAGGWELYEGRAAFNGIGDPEMQPGKPWAYAEGSTPLSVQECDDSVYAEALYVNAEGAILGYCDYSYASQEDHAAGSVTEPNWPEALAERHICEDRD